MTYTIVLVGNGKTVVWLNHGMPWDCLGAWAYGKVEGMKTFICPTHKVKYTENSVRKMIAVQWPNA